MSESAKDEPLTRFLMYKIAIRCDDPAFAAECLHLVSRSSTKDASLLYACVLDAQHTGNKSQAVDALHLVLEKHANATSRINLPSLLRITIKLTVSLIEDSKDAHDSHDTQSVIDRVCKLFEAGN